MKPLTYYIDKCITFVYIAALLGGVFVCTSEETRAADENVRYVNIRCVASIGSKGYMSADDFLLEKEKPASHEDIRKYLERLKKKGPSDDLLTDDEADEDVLDEVPGDEPEDGAVESKQINDSREEDNYDDLYIDKDDWRLMLVNKQNPVPEDFEVHLAGISESQKADERIIDDIYMMMDAAAEDGVDLMICSAYRSYDRQKNLFNNKINSLMKQGMSYLEAYREGSMNVTVPGTSEHHLGLALDILTGSYTRMDDGFGETDAGIWLAENAPKYGFILRYPRGKEEITGIVYEPWHFRYVGREYALDITKRGLCLEEYLKGGF